ncbi:MAG TPA: DUF4340 domain-containing protein [Polyangiales bacterium]|nr:DUF4340 domain-containing protein [Polyangiales bacterium]
MKGVIAHATLALIGLVLAYQTWTRKPEDDVPAASDVTIAQCSADAISAIRLETPTHFVDVEPRRQKNDTAYWITSRRKATKDMGPAPGDGVKDEAMAAQSKVGDPTVPKRFLANAAFLDYLKRMTPLRAARSLGELPKGKLADFGLDKIGTRITLTCGGKVTELEIGERTFGTGQRYVRDAKTKAAYLFDDSFVSDLQAVIFKFMQNDVHAFKLDEVDEVTVLAKNAQKRLLHRDKAVADHSTWVDASAPTTRNELYSNWFSRLSRLRVKDYLPDGADPGSDLASDKAAAAAATGETTPVMTLDYMIDGKPKGKLELVRVGEGAVAHYYARTETTRNWVTVYDATAKDIESDVGMVVGVDEAPAAPAPAVTSPH